MIKKIENLGDIYDKEVARLEAIIEKETEIKVKYAEQILEIVEKAKAESGNDVIFTHNDIGFTSRGIQEIKESTYSRLIKWMNSYCQNYLMYKGGRFDTRCTIEENREEFVRMYNTIFDNYLKITKNKIKYEMETQWSHNIKYFVDFINLHLSEDKQISDDTVDKLRNLNVGDVYEDNKIHFKWYKSGKFEIKFI